MKIVKAYPPQGLAWVVKGLETWTRWYNISVQSAIHRSTRWPHGDSLVSVCARLTTNSLPNVHVYPERSRDGSEITHQILPPSGAIYCARFVAKAAVVRGWCRIPFMEERHTYRSPSCDRLDQFYAYCYGTFVTHRRTVALPCSQMTWMVTAEIKPPAQENRCVGRGCNVFLDQMVKLPSFYSTLNRNLGGKHHAKTQRKVQNIIL